MWQSNVQIRIAIDQLRTYHRFKYPKYTFTGGSEEHDANCRHQAKKIILIVFTMTVAKNVYEFG